MANVTVKNGIGGGLVILLFLALVGSGIFGYTQYKKCKAKDVVITEQSLNKIALLKQATNYLVKIKSLGEKVTLRATEVNQLTLSRDEYKRLYQKEAEVAKELAHGKLSDVQNSTVMSTQTTGTAINLPVAVDPIKRLNAEYHDKWTDLFCTINPENMKANFTWQFRDSLQIVKTITPYRFWFIKWGTKSYQIHAVSFNPKSVITGLSYKEIRK